MSPKSLRLGLVVALALAGCAPATGEKAPRGSLFVGIDVSGSFYRSAHYADALSFAANYIYAHLHGLGELSQPEALFVTSIGGETLDEPKSFHPIHDFQGKSVGEIEADLARWFTVDDRFTDFNPFFTRVADHVKRQNLVLAPVTVVIIGDGIPDVAATDRGAEDAARYRKIDLGPLEFLARNVTVRLLYPTPTVAVQWERTVPRQRVRIWTVDAQVMQGWRQQVQPGVEMERQAALLRWIRDNVDFRARRRLL